MSLFPETIKAALGGRTVRASFLVLLDFTTQPMRIWTGSGKISVVVYKSWTEVARATVTLR